MGNDGIPKIDIGKRLKELKDLLFLKSSRTNNTGIGHTLETFLGIKENNKGEPDFIYGTLLVELKAQRKKASSRITLATKSPIWEPLKDKEIVKKFGYKDKSGRIGLKIILVAKDYNPKGFKLGLDLKKDRLEILHKDFGAVCYFKYTDLIKVIKVKLHQNLLLVLADVKKEGDAEYFHYTEAELFYNLDENKFTELLMQGKIVWEFRMHLKESGFVRDHGSGFRISRKFLGDLFEKREKIL